MKLLFSGVGCEFLAKVFLRMSGGIGNQFVQYIVAKHLCVSQDVELILDINSGFVADRVYKRSWQLHEILLIREKCINVDLFCMRALKWWAKVPAFSRFSRIKVIKNVQNIDQFRHLIAKYKLIILDTNLQEYHNFDEVKSNVLPLLSIRKYCGNLDLTNWCCLAHFRVTDHITNFNQVEFLEKAISKFGRSWNKMLIHSNDAAKAKALLSESPLELLQNAEVCNTTEALAILEMSQAKNLIIGYSTFGWSAGFLNDGGKIFCPKDAIADINFAWSENKQLNGWIAL